MEESKNILKVDTPIGRKHFIINLLWIYLYGVINSVILLLLHYKFEVNKYNLIFFLILWLAFLISMTYLFWVNLSKRMWDLFNDKGNAKFYALAYLIAINTIGFIPAIKYLGLILFLVTMGFMVFKKGKCISVDKKATDETV